MKLERGGIEHVPVSTDNSEESKGKVIM